MSAERLHSAVTESDPSTRALDRLRSAWASGTLRILVGAGVSVPARFPDWTRLNRGLLRHLIGDDLNGHPLSSDAWLEQSVDEIGGMLGRDAIAEFVASEFKARNRGNFIEALAKVLYAQNPRLEDVPLSDTHRTLAAMAWTKRGRRLLHTTNFDPVLEIALERHAANFATNKKRASNASDWRAHRGASHRRQTPLVNHLHGWVEPDGRASAEVILTESDFLETARGGTSAKKRVDQVVCAREGALLVLGMSLSDPNLRRALHERRRQFRTTGAAAPIVVLYRGGRSVADRYLERYWRIWGIDLVPVEEHSDIPEFLRRITFGEHPSDGNGPNWQVDAECWVDSHLSLQRIGSTEWQTVAEYVLRFATEKIRHNFELRQEEVIHLSLFLPERGTHIRRVATSRGRLTSSEPVKRLRTGNQAQGVGGKAYTRGVTLSAPFGNPNIDDGFDPKMKQDWDHDDGYRDWRSILAVPVHDGANWLPVATVTLTSSFTAPFWLQLSTSLFEELGVLLRRSAKLLVAESEDLVNELSKRPQVAQAPEH